MEGGGSTFWFEMMATDEPQVAVGSDTTHATWHAHQPDSAPLRLVLYVEDNLANLKLVERLIERRPDLRLVSAMTGRAGIELALARLPEVILMDINLPDIGGGEALRVLRADPTTAAIPVIAISANAMPHDVEKGRQAGFFQYLTKPIKVDEFMQTLNDALAVARGRLNGAPPSGKAA